MAFLPLFLRPLSSFPHYRVVSDKQNSCFPEFGTNGSTIQIAQLYLIQEKVTSVFLNAT